MSQKDTVMNDPGEFLVNRRSRRTTAGNRMQAALAEMAVDNTIESIEDDVDFVNDKDEEDIFASDFESTDEEAVQADTELADRGVEDEERQARKQVRARAERATAAAHARQKMTFDPDARVAPIPKQKAPKRRVSLGVAVNAETGEVLPVHKASPQKMRHSQRRHTILNTSATVTRMKQSEEKRAALPKKAKTEYKTYTQAELIALALDNEEGNLIEHRDYLKIEEEKRRKSQVIRAAVDGPLLRWVSKSEEVKTLVTPPPVPVYQPVHMPYSFSYNASGATPYGQSTTVSPANVYPSHGLGGYLAYTPGYPSINPNPISSTIKAAANPIPDTTASTSKSQPSSTAPSQQISQPAPRNAVSPVASSTPEPSTRPKTVQPTSEPQGSQNTSNTYNPYLAHLQSPSSSNLSMWVTPQQAPQQPIERIERVAKSYVIHESSQNKGTSKPPWNETMTAMFGDHVRWDELKVYVGKGRPLSRPKQTCPITGKQAKYLDPRTGVPFADVKAFGVLSKLLSHDYMWSPELHCYVGEDDNMEIIPS